SERIFQAIAIINYAKEINADAVAHGSTGAGNDQIRFDLTFDVLAPNIRIITPTRDMILTRDYEINYLREHGIEADFKKLEYSINKGLWGTSIGGKETLQSDQTLPEEAYPSQITAKGEETLQLAFMDGELQAVNGEIFTDKVKAINKVEEIGSKFGIGRDMHIGDTIIGIKGRVGFEAAAPILIINAHKMLEKHTLSKWQQYWKDQLGTWYGMFLHEAQYLEPVMRDCEAFLESAQRNVTGTVSIILRPYSYTLVGVESAFDLVKTDFGDYGEIQKGWTAEDAKGFTKVLSTPLRVYYANQKKNGKA
ncbi:MAG: argininosuccinate synthase, partial [Bacteroidaceae bacterium]